MLVTQTWREIVSLLPRFRIVAVSMQRLQVGKARITVVTIDVVHLNPVVMLEEQPTAATASVLLFEQPGQSCTDVGVSALSHSIGFSGGEVQACTDSPPKSGFVG